jgi:hypothetical protein
MESELVELREEVELLTRKVEILENKEKYRKAHGYLKLLAKVLLVLALAYGAYRCYNFIVNELPNLVVEKVKDTSKEKANNIKEAINGIFN